MIEPTEDRVLIRSEGAYYAQERPSGLVVAADDTVVDRGAPEIGEVLAVGPGRSYVSKDPVDTGSRVPMDVEVGDRVLFNRYAGDDIESLTQERLVMMRQDEILARITR